MEGLRKELAESQEDMVCCDEDRPQSYDKVVQHALALLGCMLMTCCAQRTLDQSATRLKKMRSGNHSMKIIDGQEGFFTHQAPFTEQMVKRVSQSGSLKCRETHGEPVSFGSKATAIAVAELECGPTRPTQVS